MMNYFIQMFKSMFIDGSEKHCNYIWTDDCQNRE
jgi:hypothetical protein